MEFGVHLGATFKEVEVLAAFETIEECRLLTSKRVAGRGLLVDHSLSMCDSKPSDDLRLEPCQIFWRTWNLM